MRLGSGDRHNGRDWGQFACDPPLRTRGWKRNNLWTGSISSAYWDTTTSGITDPSRGAGTPKNDPDITGITTEELQSGLPDGFDPKIWAEDPNINGALPYLRANPPPKKK